MNHIHSYSTLHPRPYAKVKATIEYGTSVSWCANLVMACVTCAGSRLSLEKRSPSGADSHGSTMFDFLSNKPGISRFSFLYSYCFSASVLDRYKPRRKQSKFYRRRSDPLVSESSKFIFQQRFNAGNMSLCYASMKLSWHLMRSLHTPSYFYIFHYTATQSQTTLLSQCITQPNPWNSEPGFS